jgi:PilZ domain
VLSGGSEPVLQSSASAPDKKAQVAGNKRDDERIPLEGQVEGEVMVFQPMTILDISVGGAQIETAFALQLDSLHDFRLTLGNRSIVVKGRIAHCHIGQLTDVTALYRTGVEFVDLTEHARNAIATFVATTKYSRNSPSVVDGIIADDDERI